MRVYILELGAHTLFPSFLKGDPVMHLPEYDMLPKPFPSPSFGVGSWDYTCWMTFRCLCVYIKHRASEVAKAALDIALIANKPNTFVIFVPGYPPNFEGAKCGNLVKRMGHSRGKP